MRSEPSDRRGREAQRTAESSGRRARPYYQRYPGTQRYPTSTGVSRPLDRRQSKEVPSRFRGLAKLAQPAVRDLTNDHSDDRVFRDYAAINTRRVCIFVQCTM